MELSLKLRKEWNRVLLELRVDCFCQEEYQLEMLRNNSITGILPFTLHGEGKEMIYQYDVTGMVSLKEKYEKERLCGKEMKKILSKIQSVAEEVGSYFLDPGRILLRPDCIFLQGEEYYFCYLPYGAKDLLTAFHELMDDFVKWTDYKDIPSVKTAFLLHRESMDIHMNLQTIAEKLSKLDLELEIKKIDQDTEHVEHAENDGRKQEIIDEEEYETEGRRRQKELWRDEGCVMNGYEWMVNQGREAMMMEETTGFFAPMKRLLGKRRRSKWGEWDDIKL